jgi:hypothetical protein
MYKKLKNANYFLIIFSFLLELFAIIIGIFIDVSILYMNNDFLNKSFTFKIFSLIETSILVGFVFQ